MPTYADALTYADAPAYGAWPPPARTLADVWQRFPAWWTEADDPLRDALAAGLRRLWIDVASAAARSAPAHLRAHAKGWALDLVARGVGLVRAEGERDAALRARIATVSDAVTAPALQAAYDAATGYDATDAPTAPRVRLIEPWRHALYANRGFLGRRPVDAAATIDAGAIPFVSGAQALFDVGPVRIWDAGVGRFILSLPPLLPSLGVVVFRGPVGGASASTDDPRASFLNRSLTGNRAFLGFQNAATTTYRTIALQTERRRAAGIRWSAFVDLTT